MTTEMIVRLAAVRDELDGLIAELQGFAGAAEKPPQEASVEDFARFLMNLSLALASVGKRG